MRPLPKEPDSEDRKKKGGGKKGRSGGGGGGGGKGHHRGDHSSEKPNISYPTNFEHTVHVGYDSVTGEFTVSIFYNCFLISTALRNTCFYFALFYILSSALT